MSTSAPDSNDRTPWAKLARRSPRQQRRAIVEAEHEPRDECLERHDHEIEQLREDIRKVASVLDALRLALVVPDDGAERWTLPTLARSTV